MLEKLYLCGITGAPPRKEITKTALGADEVVPFAHWDEPEEAARHLKEKGYTLVAVELADGAVNYSEMNYEFPVCLVFGHEVYGISEEVMELCDYSVELPMLGRANSLNVATCYGIIMYDVLKKYQKNA